jgi:hypothetical protein
MVHIIWLHMEDLLADASPEEFEQYKKNICAQAEE